MVKFPLLFFDAEIVERWKKGVVLSAFFRLSAPSALKKKPKMHGGFQRVFP